MILKTALHDQIQELYADGKGVNELEGMRLAYLASKVPAGGVIVEIGSYKGQSAAYLSTGSREGVSIYLVDLWNRENLDLVSESNQYAVAGKGHFRALADRLRTLGVYHKITPLQGLSVYHGSHWDQPIDLLFIDGDHSYEGVCSDFMTWFPHVKKGGVVAFHDYSDGWPGVKKFIDEIASKKFKCLAVHDRIWSGEK
jgi:predicted O-methyltransferase YrrM